MTCREHYDWAVTQLEFYQTHPVNTSARRRIQGFMRNIVKGGVRGEGHCSFCQHDEHPPHWQPDYCQVCVFYNPNLFESIEDWNDA